MNFLDLRKKKKINLRKKFNLKLIKSKPRKNNKIY